MGWFYGFKLHLIVNDMGELMAFKLSQATTDDRVVLPEMAQSLTGKIIGDKGYIRCEPWSAKHGVSRPR
ncbi:hypothetical protein Psal006b_01447 [Piscirickettsia salmonis]|uniref:Transposase n=2 Tax=Piscirickettsia salmonis TaxID=1238 RepID=A0AAC8VIQ5_PISSA|nr:transposase [Piscirickettsia salmonis]ALT18450.1 hypothetical protein PSLF89_06155 [Piscirickettsia salmonis LF-89 = ATCC VR-1361]ALY02892.1 hypothetical protein AWE47_08605 [Piscirickettsia salmonis]AMA42447.1 hypothetical protein AWJ11_08820 [Piscirickettsia salmonis]AOS34917.1 hypothetical protein AVM72_05960 [Piscirickettsia salmonis]